MAKRRFYVIIEMDDEGLDGDRWSGDKDDMACWIDSAMTPRGANYEVGAIVWDNLKHFFEDNVLETLAEG